jgi:hypothetical protein
MPGLDELLDREIEAGRKDVSWGTVAAILTIARLCEPSSELHYWSAVYNRWSLECRLQSVVMTRPTEIRSVCANYTNHDSSRIFPRNVAKPRFNKPARCAVGACKN